MIQQITPQQLSATQISPYSQMQLVSAQPALEASSNPLVQSSQTADSYQYATFPTQAFNPTTFIGSMVRAFFSGVTQLVTKLVGMFVGQGSSPAQPQVTASNQTDNQSLNTIAGTAQRVNDMIDSGADIVSSAKESLGQIWDIGSIIFGGLGSSVGGIVKKGVDFIKKIF